jgi:hypothetical protein
VRGSDLIYRARAQDAFEKPVSQLPRCGLQTLPRELRVCRNVSAAAHIFHSELCREFSYKSFITIGFLSPDAMMKVHHRDDRSQFVAEFAQCIQQRDGIGAA